ncbi:MAG: hypothetical protein OEY14_08130 [Myxococcales bacterium]|nr:hypothetical protein [Myxococcales bacterium]
MKTGSRVSRAIWLAAFLGLLGCEELGNPPDGAPGIWRDTDAQTVTSVRCVAATEADRIWEQVPPSMLDHVDALAPRHGLACLVIVELRFSAPPPRGPLRLEAQLELESGETVLRRFVARPGARVAAAVFASSREIRRAITILVR